MTKEQLQFVAVMAQEFPRLKTEAIADDCQRLMKLARALEREAANLCNIPDYQQRYDRNHHRLCGKVREVIDGLGSSFNFKTSGDPRGYGLKLMLPSGRYNTFGGPEEGYGVPS